MTEELRVNQMAQTQKGSTSDMPTAKNEDVEFSGKLADEEDLEAQQRAEAADARQQ